MSNKTNKTTTKTLVRIVTLIMGLGFAGSTLAIALSSMFSQENNTASQPEQSGVNASTEKQVQMQVQGYEKVLAREPKNITALEGLTQIYLQTNNIAKAVPLLEKMVKYYPERQEFAGILQIIKQQEASQKAAPVQPKTPPK
jgi:cytochrome c-type biogenesis protein CcmH/NrfG